jgi:endo-alpha-1,4-polygalactosaminidase (GH114 family)
VREAYRREEEKKKKKKKKKKMKKMKMKMKMKMKKMTRLIIYCYQNGERKFSLHASESSPTRKGFPREKLLRLESGEEIAVLLRATSRHATSQPLWTNINMRTEVEDCCKRRIQLLL